MLQKINSLYRSFKKLRFHLCPSEKLEPKRSALDQVDCDQGHHVPIRRNDFLPCDETTLQYEQFSIDAVTASLRIHVYCLLLVLTTPREPDRILTQRARRVLDREPRLY